MKGSNKEKVCPHCKVALTEWEMPVTPYTSIEDEIVYVCFNNDCPYYTRSWDVMDKQGVKGFSYRLMYTPSRDSYNPVPVPHVNREKGDVDEQISSIVNRSKGLEAQFG